MILELIGMAVGYKVGGRLGEKYLTMEQPIYTGLIEPTEVGVVLTRRGERYTLHIVQDGETRPVRQGDYPTCLASMQQWEKYVQGGGTIRAWLAGNSARQAEVARLEASLALGAQERPAKGKAKGKK
jgi:hypothetical protein